MTKFGISRRAVLAGSALGASAGLIPGVAQAFQRGQGLQSLGTSVSIADSEALEIFSNEVGDRFSVSVWRDVQFSKLTGTYDPNQTHDVVYALDGKWMLPIAAQVALSELIDPASQGFPRLLIVGIDYIEGTPNARLRDYMPANAIPEQYRLIPQTTPETTPGGAAQFLKFLENELDPLIRAKYKTTDKPAALLGDSAGGAFGAYAFTQQTELFDRYWLGSPGIYKTQEDYLGQFAATLEKELVHDTRIFISLGELEMHSPIESFRALGRSYADMVGSLRSTSNSALSWEDKIYPDKTHLSVVLPALQDAMLYLFSKT
ncbi:MAG: alpha/beta hydrolase-fold protein [Pseudomonadota bacterium]